MIVARSVFPVFHYDLVFSQLLKRMMCLHLLVDPTVDSRNPWYYSIDSIERRNYVAVVGRMLYRANHPRGRHDHLLQE